MSALPRVYRADWVLPVTSPPIARGEVLVGGDGRIAAVAPAGALEIPSDIEERDLGRAILLPGLVNVHSHPELAMFRGALEDLPFRDWILRLVGAKRRALTGRDYEIAARWTMLEAIAAGITALGATEASGAAAGALTEAGLRGVVYQEVFGPDPADSAAAIGQLEGEVDRLLTFASDRVQIGISPHAPYTVSDRLYREVARLARSAGLPVAVHIAESRAERDLVAGGVGDFAPGLNARGIATPPRGRTPIALLDSAGVLDLAPLLIHCVDLDEGDVEAIVRTDSAVAHCPVANAKLGHGVAPIPKLLAAGARVGIGTDSVASNNRLDLLEEARIGALLQRAVERAPDLMTPAMLLQLCTLDGAKAIGLDDRIGSLEPGKDADLCAVAVTGPHLRPLGDPVAALFHAARATDVILTVVAGRELYADGAHRTLDADRLREQVEDAAARIREVQ